MGLTISPVLKGVLALEELAGGVVSFTDAACIQGGLGAQDQVTAYCLFKEFEKGDECEVLKLIQPCVSNRVCANISDTVENVLTGNRLCHFTPSGRRMFVLLLEQWL